MKQQTLDIFPKPNIQLWQGDCLDLMLDIENQSIDTIITDPPYALEFMGKGWDKVLPDVGVWKECLRVAKPGAMMLVFGGDRTHHRLMVNIEDAGWEIRTCIYWLFGSGFPKSTNISKQLDKRKRRDYVLAARKLGLLPIDANRSFIDWTKEGHSPSDKYWNDFKTLIPKEDWIIIEREVIGKETKARSINSNFALPTCGDEIKYKSWDITTSATSEAQLWDGWGTALKPAAEIICVAMKTLDGTFCENALKWKVAGLNIDGGRVTTDDKTQRINKGVEWGDRKDEYYQDRKPELFGSSKGRFPANVIHDGSDEVVGLFPETKSGKGTRKRATPHAGGHGKTMGHGWNGEIIEIGHGDSGSVARFFYCAKASKAERGEGNNHPTVKPLKLMEYLCKLTMTPTGGVVLDPFMGSGTTGIACCNLNRNFIGIEKDPEYFKIAKSRLDI